MHTLNQLEAELKVSVVLPVYNEERYIATCLQSLIEQQGVSFEILIVDDGSIDSTPRIAKQFAASSDNIRILFQEHLGPGAARNLAARAARGEILAFCDGDMAFEKNYLARLIEPIERGEALGTFSKEEFVANWNNVWARCWNYNDGLIENRRHPDNWPDRHEVFRAIRRDAFLRVQGFISQGSGDDHSLSSKLGTLALAAPGAVCFHYNPESLSEAYRSARWYARGRRVPATWQNVVCHTLPVSLQRSVKRAIRTRTPAFMVMKVVVDFGILSGLIEKRLRLAGYGR